MPIEPSDAIENLRRSLSLVPPAILAIIMLAGPTAAWLLYRFVVQPRARRSAAYGSELLWICERCRSANEVRASRCYRCALDRDEIVGTIQVVDGDGIVTLAPLDDEATGAPPVGLPVMAAANAAPRPSVAVGPGRSVGAGDPTVEAVEALVVGERPKRAPVSVGPGDESPALAARPRKVVAARRSDAATRATRKRG